MEGEMRSLFYNAHNHWAICGKAGEIIYNEEGQAEIFISRVLARSAIREYHPDENCHVEKVEIR
jgi:hypothetical protein